MLHDGTARSVPMLLQERASKGKRQGRGMPPAVRGIFLHTMRRRIKAFTISTSPRGATESPATHNHCVVVSGTI